MAWIKRNLYFVIGSVAALALMGWAGYFLYSQWSLNNTVLASLNEDYEKLRSLNSQNPHPGSGQVDNIKEAKAQRDQLREFLKLPRIYFQRIAAIPDQPKVTDQDFTSALSHTLDQLQRDATNASVNIPANYGFSFEAQRPRVQFAAGSLPPLSVQLGEVKAIAEVLFQAKINWLDNLRRERVSADDSSGPQADYVPDKSVTNELAVMTPYEVTFRGFSSELAAVLSGFASSSNGFTIKTINVEPAPATDTTPAATPYSQYIPPTGQMQRPQDAAARYAQRYGINPGGPSGGDRYGGGGAANLGGIPLRGLGTPNPQPTYTPTYPTGATPPATSGRGALPTVLDEKQLKVSMAIVVVKLLPPK
jgi:hypothetical protein